MRGWGRVARILGIVAACALLVAFQAAFVSLLPVAGRHGNIVVLAVVLVGLLRGKTAGAGVGLAAGMVSDAYSGFLVGSETVLMAAAGYAAGWIGGRVFPDSLLTPVAAVGGLSLGYGLLHLLIAKAFGVDLDWHGPVFRVVLPMAFYNAVVASILWKLVLPLSGDRQPAEEVKDLERSR